MCGICGIVSRDPLGPPDALRVERLNALLAHRGPDGDGRFSDPHLLLAMRRLSIIDLAGGWQPLYNEDRTLALVANGEIYNYRELTARLQGLGHRFATASDCEVILHLYEEHGPEAVRELRGMFAFALWDGRRRRLLLARDRMGEKPLYLCEGEGRLLFASELQALLASGAIPFRPDPVSLDLYFHYQYVPEPRTPVQGVRKLDAAHILLVDVDPWRLEERRYWDLEAAEPLEAADPPARIRQELEAVSELVVRADVPVGVSLSGGLDSSAVAALAARRYPGTLEAFSVGYTGSPACDERAEARALAAHLGLPFHEVEVSGGEMASFFPELVRLRDDPIADIAGHGYYAVMRLAREAGVPVILQGQGGDELFWGYRWVRQALGESLEKDRLLRRGWGALPAYLRPRSPGGWSTNHLLAWAVDLGGLRSGWGRWHRHRASPPERMVFYDTAPDFLQALAEAPALYTSRFAERLGGERPEDLFSFPRPWPRADLRLTRLVSETYLRENGIAQGDRLSMASSIEMRLPLVDHHFVETVIGLRKGRSDCRLPPKAWLRTALRGLLPEWVMKRPKRGFAPPARAWHEAIFAAHGRSLDGGYLVQAGILTPESGRRLAAGPYPRRTIIPLSFRALVLETWCRHYA